MERPTQSPEALASEIFHNHANAGKGLLSAYAIVQHSIETVRTLEAFMPEHRKYWGKVKTELVKLYVKENPVIVNSVNSIGKALNIYEVFERDEDDSLLGKATVIESSAEKAIKLSGFSTKAKVKIIGKSSMTGAKPRVIINYLNNLNLKSK